MLSDSPPYELWGSMTVSVYSSNCTIFILFDVSNRQSFDSVVELIDDSIAQTKSPMIQKYLVGTKSDIPNREVPFDEGEALAKSNNMHYFEVSALNNTNIKQLFEDAVSKIYTIITSKENEEIDDKTLDKIGIKKFGDISGGGMETSMASMTLGSIKK